MGNNKLEQMELLYVARREEFRRMLEVGASYGLMSEFIATAFSDCDGEFMERTMTEVLTEELYDFRMSLTA